MCASVSPLLFLYQIIKTRFVHHCQMTLFLRGSFNSFQKSAKKIWKKLQKKKQEKNLEKFSETFDVMKHSFRIVYH